MTYNTASAHVSPAQWPYAASVHVSLAQCTLASGLTQELRSSSALLLIQKELDMDVQFRYNRARMARWTVCVLLQHPYAKQTELLSSGDQLRRQSACASSSLSAQVWFALNSNFAFGSFSLSALHKKDEQHQLDLRN